MQQPTRIQVLWFLHNEVKERNYKDMSLPQTRHTSTSAATVGYINLKSFWDS